MSEWLKSWRTIVGQLEPATYEPITVTFEGTKYEVLRVSLFDEEIDGTKKVVQTPSSIFEDKTALYCHLTRDTGVMRVVTTKGRFWFIVEPGSEVFDWLAAVEHVGQSALRQALRAGVLWRGIAKRAHKEKRILRLIEAEVEELNHQLAEAQHELDELKLELSRAQRELSRVKST